MTFVFSDFTTAITSGNCKTYYCTFKSTGYPNSPTREALAVAVNANSAKIIKVY